MGTPNPFVLKLFPNLITVSYRLVGPTGLPFPNFVHLSVAPSIPIVRGYDFSLASCGVEPHSTVHVLSCFLHQTELDLWEGTLP